MVARKYGLPLYATKGTADAILQSSSVGKIDPSLFHVIEAGKTFFIGNLEYIPCRSHTMQQIGRLSCLRWQTSCGRCDRLGYYDADIVSHMEGLDALLLEANHDIHMLQVGAYPYPLKQRILGGGDICPMRPADSYWDRSFTMACSIFYWDICPKKIIMMNWHMRLSA